MKKINKKIYIFSIIFILIFTSFPVSTSYEVKTARAQNIDFNKVIEDFGRLNGLQLVSSQNNPKKLVLGNAYFSGNNPSVNNPLLMSYLGLGGDSNTFSFIPSNLNLSRQGIFKFEFPQDRNNIQDNNDSSTNEETSPIFNQESLINDLLSSENINKIKKIQTISAESELFDSNQDQQNLRSEIINPQVFNQNLIKVKGLRKIPRQDVERIAEELSDSDQKVRVIIKLANTESSYATLRELKTKTRSQLRQEFLLKTNRIKEVANPVKRIISLRGDEIKLDESNFLMIGGAVVAEVKLSTLEELNRSNNVAEIYYDYPVKTLLSESIPQIGANIAWQQSNRYGLPLRGFGTKIAIIDTGVDYTHQFLGGCLGSNCKVYGGYDFVNRDLDPMDDNGHGTHVAGIAAGKDPSNRYNGVAPEAKILAVKVLGARGSGFTSDVVAGILFASDPNRDGDFSDRVDVINLSLGSDSPPGGIDTLAVEEVTRRGIVVVASAGNSGPRRSSIGSPANAPHSIAVGASCKIDLVGSLDICSNPIARFSSRGPVYWNGVNLFKPDISAPGVRIISSISGGERNRTVALSGTSMAAPHIAGVAAILRQAYPELSPLEIKEMIKRSARDLGYGLTYDDQGAGEFNFNLAPIFGLGYLRFNPIPYIRIESDPTQRYNNFSHQFRISSLGNLGWVNLRVNNPFSSGLSINLSDNRFNFTEGSEHNFNISFVIDNDLITIATQTVATIDFINNQNNIVGKIYIDVIIKDQVEASPLEIDYGVMPGELNTWISEWKEITFTNLRRDREFNLTNLSFQQPTRVTIEFNRNNLIIPPGGRAVLMTRALVNNAENGHLNGEIILDLNNIRKRIPTKLFKGYVINIRINNQDSNSESINHLILYKSYNFNRIEIYEQLGPNESKTFYLPLSGYYYLSFVNQSIKELSLGGGRYILKFQEKIIPKLIFIDNINPYQEIVIDDREANKKISYRFFDEENRERLVRVTNTYIKMWPIRNMYYHQPTGLITIFCPEPYLVRIEQFLPANLDPNYYSLEFLSQIGVEPNEKLYFLYDNMLDNSQLREEVNFGGRERYRTYDFYLSYKHNVIHRQVPLVDFRITKNFGGWYSALIKLIYEGIYPSLPFRTKIYYDFNGNYENEDLISVYQRNTIFRTNNNYYFSPITYLPSKRRSGIAYLSYFNQGTLIPSVFLIPSAEGNIQNTNLGPIYFSGKLLNTNEEIRLYPSFYIPYHLNSNLEFPPRYLIRSSLLTTADYAKVSHPLIPLNVVVNNQVLINTSTPQVDSVYNLYYSGIYNPPSGMVPLVKVNIPPHLRNDNLQINIGPINWTWSGSTTPRLWLTKIFNLSRNDKNPPTIKSLRLYNDDQLSENYDSNKENKIVIEVDPVEGQISNFKAFYSVDGNNFIEITSVNLNLNEGRANFILPRNLSTNLITLKFEAGDDSNNKLIHYLEIPNKNISNVTEDNIPPTVRFIEPLNNQNLSEIATVTFEANDNVGIRKLSFYINNNLIREIYNPPYQTFVNTFEYLNGTYTFKVIVEDLNNNTSSAAISVVFNNRGSRLLMVNPPSESTLSGVATIEVFLGGRGGRVSLVLENSENRSQIILNSTSTQNPFRFYWDTSNINRARYNLKWVRVIHSTQSLTNIGSRISYLINNSADLNLNILSPLDNQNFEEGNNITFSAQTSRLANFSAQIINSDNNTNFDTFTCNNTISCSRQYNNLPPANYRFNVIATDVNNSNNREERNVNFRVQRRTDIPQLNLNIISPQNNSQLYTGTINLIASTSRRSNIRFSLNKIGTSIYLFPPECNNVDYCSRTVNISEEGRYRLIVRAFDSQFPEIREERSIEFEARRREESRPELNLRILFPIDASQYLEGNNITFSAQTSRLANFSAQIINSDNNTNFDTFTCNNTISCSRQYNNLPPANYRFNVIATDVNNSNNREERNVNFRVMARQQEQPSISLIISWPPQNYITYIAPDRSEASLNFRAETNIVANFNMEVINNSNNNIITSFSCSSTTRCDRYNINLPEGDYQLRVRATDINRQDNSVTLSHTFRVVRMRETDNSNLRPTNFNVRFEERNNRGFPVFRFTWETPTGITSLNPLVEYRLYYCTNNPDCRPTSFRSAYGVFRGSYPTSWLIDINSNNNYFKFVLMAIYNNGEFAYSNTAEINLSSGGNLNIQDNMLANFLLLLMMLLNDRNR